MRKVKTKISIIIATLILLSVACIVFLATIIRSYATTESKFFTTEETIPSNSVRYCSVELTDNNNFVVLSKTENITTKKLVYEFPVCKDGIDYQITINTDKELSFTEAESISKEFLESRLD